MVLDPRKRQKKLERQKSKQRAKNKAVARYGSRDIAVRLDRYAAAPILHCTAPKVLWTEGIGNVLVSRELTNGDVAFASFLVDIYCLGVKDAFYNIVPRHHYDNDLYFKLMRFPQVPLRPECARKLVEGAVEYARGLGLSAHDDYRIARRIFGEIDAATCSQEFGYGKEGKPFFVAGPHDDLARCKGIIGLLTAHCGTDGFHYLVRLSEDEMRQELPNLIPPPATIEVEAD